MHTAATAAGLREPRMMHSVFGAPRLGPTR